MSVIPADRRIGCLRSQLQSQFNARVKLLETFPGRVEREEEGEGRRGKERVRGQGGIG